MTMKAVFDHAGALLSWRLCAFGRRAGGVVAAALLAAGVCAGAEPESQFFDEPLPGEAEWICPDEPFAAGVGRPRFYRRSFDVADGLVSATARWWVDDTGRLWIDGKGCGRIGRTIEPAADFTERLKSPGRHVLAIEAVNMAGAGGVCLALELAYANGTTNRVVTLAGEWRCAKSAADGWQRPAFDDSAWERPKRHGGIHTAPWCALADMTRLASPAEKARLAGIEARRRRRLEAVDAALAKEAKAPARIVYEKGKPLFEMGGRRWGTAFYNCSEGWSLHNSRLHRQVAMFRDAGMHVYGIGVHVPRVWREDGTMDFDDAVAKIRSVLAIDPDARFQFCFDASAQPEWWLRKHPDELVGYQRGTIDFAQRTQTKNVAAASFASGVWRREMSDFLTRWTAFLESTPYASRILSYRPDFGIHHEWHYYGMCGGLLPDSGRAMERAFRDWLRRAYGGDRSALRKAWGDPSASFETAALPSPDARLRHSAGAFRDAVKDRAVLDYLRCHAEQVRDCQFAFNRAVKEACGGRALVGNYCGYFFGMPFPAEGFHLENNALLDSPWVDFQCSPYVYGRTSRAPGNVQYARCLLEGLRRRGKLALLEADNVMSGFPRHPHGNYTEDVEEDVALLARDFAQTLCWGCGYWYFDFGIGWYDRPEFGEFFKKIYPIREEVSDCRSVSEVLVVGDYDSVAYVSVPGREGEHQRRTTDLVNALGHAGVPFDTAEVADVASGALKDYKVYLFCNLVNVTPEKRALVDSLRAKGRAVVLPDVATDPAALRGMLSAAGVHVWNDDPQTAVYANASCVALHSALPGEKTIRLPAPRKVTMLYPERRLFSEKTDRIVFTPSARTLSTTLFKVE